MGRTQLEMGRTVCDGPAQLEMGRTYLEVVKQSLRWVGNTFCGSDTP